MRNGFTLLEIIIALALLSLFLMAGTRLFSAYFRTYRAAAHNASHLQIKLAVLREITRDCRGAKSVAAVNDRAVFYYADHTVAYDLKNNKVRRTEGKSSAYLTDDNEIKELSFRLINPYLIRIKVDDLETEGALRNG
jgi:prepilin-type N-terminal cleavage/methylation domain-containing protein